MEITGLLMLFIQIGFAIHALKRGHPIFWVFLIVFVPLIGCILYVVMVMLPELGQSRAAAQGTKALRKALDPGKELRERREALERSDTVGTRVALAQAYMKQRMFDEAIPLYENSLVGMYQSDPELLLGLATALVESKRFQCAGEVLDSLYAQNPDYAHPNAHLLYARVLDEMGETDRALEEYARLLESLGGPEVKCRYGLLLKKAGRDAEARPLFEDIVRDARGGSKHSRQLNREWVEIARRELA